VKEVVLDEIVGLHMPMEFSWYVLLAGDWWSFIAGSAKSSRRFLSSS